MHGYFNLDCRYFSIGATTIVLSKYAQIIEMIAMTQPDFIE
jgi:hypothetical protein